MRMPILKHTRLSTGQAGDRPGPHSACCLSWFQVLSSCHALANLPKECRPRWSLKAQILAEPSISRFSEGKFGQRHLCQWRRCHYKSSRMSTSLFVDSRLTLRTIRIKCEPVRLRTSTLWRSAIYLRLMVVVHLIFTCLRGRGHAQERLSLQYRWTTW